MYKLLMAAALALAGCAGPPPMPVPTAQLTVASGWEIGPVIGGKSRSPNTPLHPTAQPGGWYFDFPLRDGVHYVTVPYSLRGKKCITLHYHVAATQDTRLLPSTDPTAPSIGPTLYLQQKGDDWSGEGKYETYRWWATFASAIPIPMEGEQTVRACKDQNWTAIMSSSRASNPTGFAAAWNDTVRIGFTFGGGSGYGHGVFATGTARFVLTGFEVE